MPVSDGQGWIDGDQPGAVCEPVCETSTPPAPLGANGSAADRDATNGRFVRGNRAALVAGHRSKSFWEAQGSQRAAIVRAVVVDAGFTVEDAPRGLMLAADGIAQCALIRDSAFQRLVEGGGPLTTAGRERRAFTVWLKASSALEGHLRVVGVRREPKRATSFADAIRQAVDQAKEEAC